MGNNSSSPVAAASSPSSEGLRKAPTRSTTLKFRTIKDNYSTIEQVQDELRRQGLESSNLIVAVDFTKSNEWTGKHSFAGKSLHHIGSVPNPYEEAITIIGKTLRTFDDDGMIQAYGFGDATTGDRAVFAFQPNNQACVGLEGVVWRYRELVPYVKLAGPTSFAPAIYQAMQVVAASGGQYHILLLIADGQVTRSSDLPASERSSQEQETVDAIVAASNFPLSIVLVGVGDGPWDLMREFDDRLPQRNFDNFQFVNFTELARGTDARRREATFALRALMEIPDQYRTIQALHLLNKRQAVNSNAPRDPPGPASAPLPPAQAPPAYAPPAPAAPSAAINQMFICPITQEIMAEPVIAADGYTYERAAIEQWLRSHDTSPLSNVRLPHKQLVPNHNLRSTILETYPNLGRR